MTKRRIVKLSFDHDEVGEVMAEGPYVTEVRFPAGDRFIMNDKLIDVSDEEAAKKSTDKVPKRGRKSHIGIARRE